MESIAKQMTRLDQFQKLSQALDEGKWPVLVTGVAQVHKAQIIHAITTRDRLGAVIITPDEQSAARLCEEINLFAGEVISWQYPERELTLRPVEGVSREYEHLRL